MVMSKLHVMGKIEWAALRGQVILKELSWKRKSISAVFNSAIAQNVQLEIPGEIQSITGDKKCKITNINNLFYLLLPAKQEVFIKLVLK